MEQMRSEFEIAFAKSKSLSISDVESARCGDGYWDESHLKTSGISKAWHFWQASRAAMTPACWITYYPDTDEESWRPHSESGESCARRIASEIGGYVVPVYHGEPQQCAAGLRIKGE